MVPVAVDCLRLLRPKQHRRGGDDSWEEGVGVRGSCPTSVVSSFVKKDTRAEGCGHGYTLQPYWGLVAADNDKEGLLRRGAISGAQFRGGDGGGAGRRSSTAVGAGRGLRLSLATWGVGWGVMEGNRFSIALHAR